MIESSEAIIIIVFAILPGFVSHLVYRSVLPGESPTGQSLVLISLAFATINLSLHLAWIIPIVLDPSESIVDWTREHMIRSLAGGLVYLLISPALIGYAPALIRKHVPIPGLVDPVPTAWDHFFIRNPGCVVYARMKDGKVVAGLYSKETGGFASSYPQSPTLYCGRVFPTDENGLITGPPESGSKGVILRFEDCNTVEFLEVPTIDSHSLWTRGENEEDGTDGYEENEH